MHFSTTPMSSSSSYQIEYNTKTVIYSDEILLKFLITLNRWGIAIIKDAGYDQSCVEQLGQRIGYLKQTTYG